MTNNGKKKIYSSLHFSLFDRLLVYKREQILYKIKKFLYKKKIDSILDVGSTEDNLSISSNFIIRNLGNYKIYKSISDQNINLSIFKKTLKKSITKKFNQDEVNQFQSDLVISNATIEHVGSFENQIIMCKNLIKFSKKYFIIITPNRYHFFDFHTKIPILHWLPKNLHRKILSILGLKFYSDEKNLNLLCEKDLKEIMYKINCKKYIIQNIKFFFMKSNLILIGKKN